MKQKESSVAQTTVKNCTCTSKYCEHYKSDFDKYSEEHKKSWNEGYDFAREETIIKEY